jgi:hypothetical protein
MMHNDFHYGNILIDNSVKTYPGSYFVYEINGKTYYLKNTGIIPKLFDFEFCMVYSNKISGFYPNKLIVKDHIFDPKTFTTLEKNISDDESDASLSDRCIPMNYNEVYDLHYFLCSLLDRYISNELFEWITSIYPPELIPDDSDTSYTSSIYTSDTDSTHTSYKSTQHLSQEDFNKHNTLSSYRSHSSTSSETSTSDSYSDSSDSSNDSNRSDYLYEGRLLNGVEKLFNDLPTPKVILNHPFFDNLTIQPLDFNKDVSYFFKSGIH